MIGALGMFSVLNGAVVAYLAERFPAHAEALRTCAGIMLIGGLALSGYALPVIL